MLWHRETDDILRYLTHAGSGAQLAAVFWASLSARTQAGEQENSWKPSPVGGGEEKVGFSVVGIDHAASCHHRVPRSAPPRHLPQIHNGPSRV